MIGAQQAHATDFRWRLPLSLGLLPKVVPFQLCGKREITDIACISLKVL